MLYVDIPTRSDMSLLAAAREPGTVSIYLATTPITQDIDASRIALGNFIKEAEAQLQQAQFDKRALARIVEQLQDLEDDDDFWRYQARSLAIFVTSTHIRTYRLPNVLTPMVQVSDRFHLKPLFRAITFPHSAFILALSENAVRLLEMHADELPVEIKVDDLPKDAASAAGKSTLNDRSHSGRIHGSEGQNVRFDQYVRKVNSAIRPMLNGLDTPLILAATGRLASVFPQLNTYPHLLEQTIADSPDRMSEGELAALARPVLDAFYREQLDAVLEVFAARQNERRVTTDLSDAGRAATFGAIDTLLVDIDAVVPGQVNDETGAITLAEQDDAVAYGIVDEIAVRAFVSGARVLGVRREDIPGQAELAAILRYPL